MKEMEKVVQEETFEIEVQYCDPDDCNYDCMVSENLTASSKSRSSGDIRAL